MGLHNREYMRSPYPDPSQNGRPMLTALIIINIACYFLKLAPALKVNGRFEIFQIFQLVTAGFAHADFFHLLFNMWGLYIFGQLVVPYVSKQRFLAIYLAGVISGNLLFYVLNFRSYASLVGASGGVCGMMIAAAMLEPNRRFTMLFLPFSPIKTTTLVICYTVMEVLMLLGNQSGNVAHLAHLGGFLGGYIAMKVIFRNICLPWDPLNIFALPSSKSKPRTENHQRTNYGATGTPPPAGDAVNAPVTQRELDTLLDKLSREGINSLSPFEFERLKKARRQMRGEE